MVFVGVRAVLPKRLGSGPAAVGALVSVPAALGFSLLFAVGGTAPVSATKVLVAMVAAHRVGEAVITALVVGSVVAVRPHPSGPPRAVRPQIREPATAGDTP